jgi:hypothetical protein
MGWVGNDAAKDLYERSKTGLDWEFMAKVRPRGDGFGAIVFVNYRAIPVGVEYATQDEAQVAAMGFIKLLMEK